MLETRTRDLSATAGAARIFPRTETPIVPKNSVAGRALVILIAIMTFLASLTAGAVVLVRSAASEWQADVAREVTVQVRPIGGRDLEADLNAALAILRATPGIAEAHAYSQEQSARLLEPWLGGSAILEDLPVPRLIVVRIDAGVNPELSRLRRILNEQVASALLDDHRAWIDRMRAVSATAVLGGLVLLGLMLLATVLSISFATRGAMEANRPIIEVLHFIGARNRFIAGRFQRHFLAVGLQGGAMGGAAAILLFLLAQGVVSWLGAGPEDQFTALFGRFSLGLSGHSAIVALVLLIAAITALTSRYTVNRTLENVD